MSCGSADGRVILGGMDLGRERARKRNAGLARVLDHFFHRLAQLLQDGIAVAAMHAPAEQLRLRPIQIRSSSLHSTCSEYLGISRLLLMVFPLLIVPQKCNGRE